MFLQPSLLALLSLLLLNPSTVFASPSSSSPPLDPCTLYSPSSGSFLDLRKLQVTNVTKSKAKDPPPPESWHSKGYDYGANFTINICAPVVEKLHDVVGIPQSRWPNVSAYYTSKKGEIYSIGQQSAAPMFRGKKLVLNYTDGSPCPDLDADGHPEADRRRKIIDDDDEGDDDGGDDGKTPSKKPSPGKGSSSGSRRRKTTLLSFLCDRDPSLSSRPAISFVGSPDHCTYFFEVRSRYACGGTIASTESGSLGPGGVFAVIFGIALLVYLLGGCAYQRTVMHQRGWKQVPNYSVWAGLFGFVSDMTIILFSSCTSRMPSVNRLFNKGGGYHRVGNDDRRAFGGNGRGRTPDDENRLIDQLDEEWDD